jgi:hypothetical protein
MSAEVGLLDEKIFKSCWIVKRYRVGVELDSTRSSQGGA